MRENKFRVWDTMNKTWVMPLSSAILNYGDGNEITYSLNDRNGRLIFVSYTGLKDKNGIEIYEGDIVANEHNHKMEVFYRLAINRAEWVGRVFTFKYGGYILGWFEANLSEVIGNIYENPELLEANK